MNARMNKKIFSYFLFSFVTFLSIVIEQLDCIFSLKPETLYTLLQTYLTTTKIFWRFFPYAISTLFSTPMICTDYLATILLDVCRNLLFY